MNELFSATINQHMFEDAHYRWKDNPVDGEYELQFDRFETSSSSDHYDKAVLLIAKTDTTGTVGDVTLRTAAVPALDPDEPNMTRIFHATIEKGKIVEMNYDPELSQQRHEEAKDLYNSLVGNTDDERDTDD